MLRMSPAGTTNIVVYLRSFTSDALRDMALARSRESSKEIDDEEQVHLPLVHYLVEYLGQEMYRFIHQPK